MNRHLSVTLLFILTVLLGLASCALPTSTPIEQTNSIGVSLTTTVTADSIIPLETPTPLIDLHATAIAESVMATLTAEAQVTPTPDSSAEIVAQAAFTEWATSNGEPFRDVLLTIQSNDGFFAQVQVVAWFRPNIDAEWEERAAMVECRKVGDAWQCDRNLQFVLSEGETIRRGQITATAVAIAQVTSQAAAIAEATEQTKAQTTATAEAIIRVTATAVAIAQATSEIQAIATAEFYIFSEKLQPLTERFGINFVHIPSGAFTGTSTSESVHFDDFWISLTEITNAQYQFFIEAGGYEDSTLWWWEDAWTWRTNSKITAPSCWNDENLNKPAQPVTCVSEYEARAYASWLGREIGEHVRLPYAIEFIIAAEGMNRQIYPWGDQALDGSQANFCDVNCNLSHKNASVNDGYTYTAPVGSYPKGTSTYGVMDIIGNVSEWTDDCDWVYGGNWGSDGDSLMIREPDSQKWRDLPLNAQLNTIGFRVVVSPPWRRPSEFRYDVYCQ